MRSWLVAFAAATAVAAGVAPEQVRLSFTRSTGAMHVHWATHNTSTPADYAGVVQWGEMVLTNEAPAVSSSYTIWGYHASHLHNAVMEGLHESTVYFYRVGSERDGWSPAFNFSTAPPAGTGSYPVSFIAYGDMGVLHSQNTVALAAQMLRRGDASFIIHAGDVSYADDRADALYESVQDEFYNEVQAATAYAPYMMSSGNHEIKGDWLAYTSRVAPTMPTNASGSPFWYSWNYGPVHFLAFDSDQAHAVGSEQYDWVVADLAAVDRTVTPWTVAYNHFPLACTNEFWCVPSSAALRAIFEPVFNAPETRVDLYLAGHVHAAEVLYPQVNMVRTQASFDNINQTLNVMVGFPGDIEVCCNSWLQPKPAVSFWRDDDVASDGGFFGFSHISIQNATHMRVSMWDAGNQTEVMSVWVSRALA